MAANMKTQHTKKNHFNNNVIPVCTHARTYIYIYTFYAHIKTNGFTYRLIGLNLLFYFLFFCFHFENISKKKYKNNKCFDMRFAYWILDECFHSFFLLLLLTFVRTCFALSLFWNSISANACGGLVFITSGERKKQTNKQNRMATFGPFIASDRCTFLSFLALSSYLHISMVFIGNLK